MWYLFVLSQHANPPILFVMLSTVAVRSTLLALPGATAVNIASGCFLKPNPVCHAPLLLLSAIFLMLPDKLLCYRNKHAIWSFARVQASGGKRGYPPVLDPVTTVNLHQLQIMDSTGALRPPIGIDHYPDFAVNLTVDMMHAGAM